MRAPRRAGPVLLGLALLLAASPALPGGRTEATVPQSAAAVPGDSLRLGDLQRAAVARDPRLAERELRRRTTALRLRTLDADRLPAFQVAGNASYQSEVTEIPFDRPGVEPPTPPKDRYETTLGADWLVWDGGRTQARQGVEEARLDAELAMLDAELHDVRVQVSDAFFGALLAQERLREGRLLLEDLDARLTEVRAQVRAGTGLPGDTAVVRADLLGARQRVDALEAERRAALDVLGELTGRTLDDAEPLALPELDAAVGALPEERAAPSPGAEAEPARGVHPRYDLFDARREELRRRAATLDADRMPRISAFGQLSWGSPGFRQFEEDLHEYWRAGIQLQWQPWTWGTRSREREILQLQERLVDTRQQAFTDQLRRAVQAPLRTMERLRASLEQDREIIALREQVERQARAQLAERAIPVSRYTDARTDLTEARVAQLRHRVELARAQAHYLLILGAEIR